MTVQTVKVHPEDPTKLSHLNNTYHRAPYPALIAAQSSGAGKTVLVTNASSPMGRSIALSWARANVSGIAICCEHFDDLFPVVAAITAIKPSIKLLAMTCETTKSSDVTALFSAAMEKFGRLDVVVANVGTSHQGMIGEGEEDGWWEVMTSNLRSTHLIAHHYACVLAPSCTGAFISVMSGADTVVLPGLSSYGIAKQATRRLVEFLPVEYPQLKVFELDPGIVQIRTVFDMGKGFAYDSPELAGMVSVWLGSERADHLMKSYLHVTWDIEEMEKLGCQTAGNRLVRANPSGDARGQDCIAVGECSGHEPNPARKGLNGIEVEIIQGVVKVKKEYQE
jgi:NAD(P)-dependent dehydrogenase (short-subunit alcohol dehydrogenase family)